MYILLKENMNKENVKSVLWHLFPATSESSIIIGTDNGRKKKRETILHSFPYLYYSCQENPYFNSPNVSTAIQ